MNSSTKQKSIAVISILFLSLITFSLGYWMGSKTKESHLELISPPLSSKSSDLEHAFGMVKPADHEKSNAVAMSLGELVAGLEKKVAANPDNIDQQLLLAQTYKELNDRDKSLSLLQALNKRISNNAQVKLTLAIILMNGMEKSELNQASQLFNEAIKLQPDLREQAKTYQHELKAKLKNTK